MNTILFIMISVPKQLWHIKPPYNIFTPFYEIRNFFFNEVVFTQMDPDWIIEQAKVLGDFNEANLHILKICVKPMSLFDAF